MTRAGFEARASDGVVLRGFVAEPGGVGEGGAPPAADGGRREGPSDTVVLAHGLTAHRDLVVHGSRALPRAGVRLVSADARGHGESDPGASGSYVYEQLADDLQTVVEEAATAGERPVLAGHSMGAHTIIALALRAPERYAGMVLIGPASRGEPLQEDDLRRWDSLADGLAEDGVDGFMRAYDSGLDPAWRETLMRIARDRLARHRHPGALAQALREVPRSVPFPGLDALARLDLPSLVVASHDQADPGHPYATAVAVTEALPDARLISEAEGESPLAWQGGKLSREIAAFCASDAVRRRR